MSDIEKILNGKKLFLIAGPCVIESEELCLEIGAHLKLLSERHGIPVIFKSSYAKANRTSAKSFSGNGMEFGLEVLKKVKDEYGLPVLTDIHETVEIEPVAKIADVLQIPAFLCRQTELIRRAGETGKWINIKKGQFMSPHDMDKAAAKAESKKVMLTERGASFGYHNLVVDFRSLLIMREFGFPVVFDATHSLQLPSGSGTVSSGQPEFVIPFARAAVAVGVAGLFVETHPDPSRALSDAGAMLPMDNMEQLIIETLKVRKALE